MIFFLSIFNIAIIEVLEQGRTIGSVKKDPDDGGQFAAIAYDSRRLYLFTLIGNEIRKFNESLTMPLVSKSFTFIT